MYFIPKCDNSNIFPLDVAGTNLDQGPPLIMNSSRRTGTPWKAVLSIKLQKRHVSTAHLSFGLKTTKEQPGILFQIFHFIYSFVENCSTHLLWSVLNAYFCSLPLSLEQLENNHWKFLMAPFWKIFQWKPLNWSK